MYLKYTKATCDRIIKRINVMILREHFFYKDASAAGFEAARTGDYDYIVHDIPNMFEWRHASI